MAITGTARRQFTDGAIRSEMSGQSQRLDFFNRRTRNSIARTAFIKAGQAWIAQFLPKRFTPYVFRAPFSYPRKGGAWLATKLRNAKGPVFPQKWAGIKQRWFDGWDPWSSQPPPASLVQKWVQKNPDKYKRRSGVVGFILQLSQSKKAMFDLRKWAKTKTREIAQNMQSDDIIRPLVSSGELRDTYSKMARADAKVTSSRVRMFITMPRGGRQNPTVVRVLGKLPHYEYDFIVRQFIANYRAMIAEETVSKVNKNVASLTERMAVRRDASESRKMASAFSRKQFAQASRISYGHD